MTHTYRDKIDVGGLAIQISIVAENGGPHVEVWPEFDDEDRLPPGLKDAITAWCSTDQAQNWAMKQDPSNTDGD
ncbi:MAG: hypothetical protein KAV00_03500 [Phycisphaerae bacterium]|nr:hypothetical protein [Phycisphaerae bacterium]